MVYKEESIMRIGIVSNWISGCASTSRSMLTYCVMEQILRQSDRDGRLYRKDWVLTRMKDRCIRILLWIPATAAACIYRAKKL